MSDIDDGSDKPIGTLSDDGELEVRALPDGSRCWHETALGQHQRWLRQAPDLFEVYQAVLSERDALTAELVRIRVDFADDLPDRVLYEQVKWLIEQAAESDEAAAVAEHELLVLQQAIAKLLPDADIQERETPPQEPE